MAKLTLHKDNCVDYTVISNIFIDKYMGDANDAQLKVYLYLIRMMSADQATSVSDIADKFNHTEKDVMRSLRYWEKRGLLTLEYDQSKNLVGIYVNSITATQDEREEVAEPVQGRSIVLQAETVAPFTPIVEVSMPETVFPASVSAPMNAAVDPYAKPSFTTEQLKEFKSRKNVRQLLIIAEKYLSRTLSVSEMQTILFFSDTLHFSDDLIIALLEYCIDHGKKDFKYIEKVAVNWAQEGITTPEEAQKSSGKYSKNVYVIMNELGKSTVPTTKEMEYISRWLKEYEFSLEIILDACQRTVLATDRHRFEYCDSILTSWKNDGVSQKADIAKMDELHQKKKSVPKQPAKSVPSGKFGQFSQNEYDFDDLTKKLISN